MGYSKTREPVTVRFVPRDNSRSICPIPCCDENCIILFLRESGILSRSQIVTAFVFDIGYKDTLRGDMTYLQAKNEVVHNRYMPTEIQQ